MVCAYVNHYLLGDKNHWSLDLMMAEFISTMGMVDFLCMLHFQWVTFLGPIHGIITCDNYT